jgi:hypothetical protein
VDFESLQPALAIVHHLHSINSQTKENTKMPADNPTTAWLRYENALRDKISGGNQWKGLQLVEVPIPANWDDPKYGDYYKWVIWGDIIPKWSSAYGASANRLSDAYYTFLTNLSITPPKDELKDEVDKAYQAYIGAVDQLSKTREDSFSAWPEFNDNQKKFPPNRQKSFDAWYANTWGRKIGMLEQQVTNLGTRYESYYVNQLGGMSDAANALVEYHNDAYLLEADAPDGSRFPYRTYNISPELSEFNRDNENGVGSSLEIKFDETTSKDEKHSWGTQDSASYSAAFWSVKTDASYEKSTIDTSTSGFSCTFKFPNWQLFTITPGRWFKGTVLAAYGQKGPWIPDGQVAKGQFQLFGENGIFSLMATQLVVAYQPEITIKMGSSDYNQVKDSWKASASVQVGGFNFDSSAQGGNDKVTTDDSSSSITLKTTSKTPLVIAVVNSILPGFTN